MEAVDEPLLVFQILTWMRLMTILWMLINTVFVIVTREDSPLNVSMLRSIVRAPIAA